MLEFAIDDLPGYSPPAPNPAIPRPTIIFQNILFTGFRLPIPHETATGKNKIVSCANLMERSSQRSLLVAMEEWIVYLDCIAFVEQDCVQDCIKERYLIYIVQGRRYWSWSCQI